MLFVRKYKDMNINAINYFLNLEIAWYRWEHVDV